MAVTLNVAGTVSNLKNRIDALNGKTLKIPDWIEELVVHIILLEKICVQQQEEIDTLKKKNLF